MHRRTYLTTLVGTATLAGCLGSGDSGPAISETVRDATRTFDADAGDMITATIDVQGEGMTVATVSNPAEETLMNGEVKYYRKSKMRTNNSGTHTVAVTGNVPVDVTVEVTSND